MKYSLCLFAAFVLSACGVTPQDGAQTETQQNSKPNQTSDNKPDQGSAYNDIITGTLTDEGVMCQAMRGEDGRLYVFEDLPEDLENGDELMVEGEDATESMPSYCDQGEVIIWTAITKIENGTPIKAWRKDM